MARHCTICKHAERTEIDKALIEGVSLRNIAKRFGITEAAVFRHNKGHLTEALLKSKEAKEVVHGMEIVAEDVARQAGEADHANRVMNRLEEILVRTNRLFDACDEWLRDPDDPEKYCIEPRSEDVSVVYLGRDSEGKPVRMKDRLSVLLSRIEERSVDDIKVVEVKHADPRKLILDTAAEFRQGIMLHLNILEVFYNTQRMRQFQEIVLREVANADPQIRKQIIDRLQYQWDARRVVEYSQPTG